MKLTVERKPASLMVLDITADEDEMAEATVRAYRKVSRDVQVPGFRKGKAPRHIIENMYGRDVFLREAADEVMDKLYREALKQEDITPVGEPSVEVNDFDPVNFVVTVPVFPTVDLGGYADIRVDPVDAEVTDADVDEVLSRLQKSQGTWVELPESHKPGEGDQVTVDYEVTLNGEPFQEPIEDAVFVLGETNLLVTLREKLETLEVGETSEFELSFDEDDDTADPSIRGMSLNYKVTLKGVNQRELPELDDEFARKVNDSETLAELREQIGNDLHASRTTEGRTTVLNTIIDQMASQAEIDAPEVMVDEEVEHQLNHLKEDLQKSNTPWQGYLRMQNKTEDDIKEDLRPEAARRLRNSLFLQEVGRKEEVVITEADVDEEISNLTGAFSPRDDSEEARAMAETMAQFYQSDYYRNMLRNQAYERKLTDRLIELATEGKGAVTNPYVAPVNDVIDVVGEITGSDESVIDVEVVDVVAESTTDAAPQTFSTAVSEDAVEETFADDALVAEALAGDETGDSVPFEGAVAGDGSTEAPEGFPIKGNADSMIYHMPGGSSYAQTIAEYYFATLEEAEAAGFRAARR